MSYFKALVSIDMRMGRQVAGRSRTRRLVILVAMSLLLPAAVTGGGLSDGAAEASAASSDLAPTVSVINPNLAAPTHVCGTSGNNEVRLNWTAPSDPDRVGFLIEHRIEGAGTWETVQTANLRTATIPSTNGQPREFRVASRDQAGDRSEWGSYCLLEWDHTADHPIAHQRGVHWPYSEGRSVRDYDPACIVDSIGDLRCIGRTNETDRAEAFGSTVATGITSLGTTSRSNGFRCAVTEDGAAVCWGENRAGQLGDGTSQYRATAVTALGVLAEASVVAVSTGDEHTCAVTDDGRVACWGSNQYGQLGLPLSTTSSLVPVWIDVAALGGITLSAVSAGPTHTCALSTDGSLICWGDNQSGQLGRGSTSTTELPGLSLAGALGGATLSAIASNASCGVSGTHQVICWGPTPSVVDQGDLQGVSVSAISTGSGHTCALTFSGQVVCWGYNNFGQTGAPPPQSQATPRLVGGGPLEGKQVSSIRLHHHSSCASVDDRLACWGYLGDAWTESSTPVSAFGSSLIDREIVAVSSRSQWTCAVSSAGELSCWYNPSNGDPYHPRRVRGVLEGQHVIDVNGGWGRGCAITLNLRLACWGHNNTDWEPVWVDGGALTSASVSAVVLGDRHTCALTITGAVACWGSNQFGQLGTGSVNASESLPVAVAGGALSTTTASAIAAGLDHTCAVTADERVACWGYNGGGQVRNSGLPIEYQPVPVAGGALQGARVRSVANGDGHSCALTTNSSVVCWGESASGQRGNGYGVSGSEPTNAAGGVLNGAAITRLSSQRYGTCATDDRDRVICWGGVTPPNSPSASDPLGLRRFVDHGRLRGGTTSSIDVDRRALGVWGGIIAAGDLATPPRSPSSFAQGRQVTATWLSPAWIGSAPLTGFRVESSANGGATWSTIKTVGTVVLATFEVPGDGSWMFRVRSLTAAGASEPSATSVIQIASSGGGSSGGGSSGGGGSSSGGGGGAPSGGGGGGSSVPRGEPVTAGVSPPASRMTPAVVELSVPAGRVELRLTGLTRAAEASVTVIDPPETRGITLLPTAFDIDVVTAGGLDQAELCVPVDADELAEAGVDAQRLSLFHFDPTPVDITTRSSSTEVCGVTSSFSPFAVGMPATSRVAGTNRYETAAQLVAQAFPSTEEMVLVATGTNFPDALAASAAAANADAPLLLVTPGAIPAVTRAQIVRLRPQRIVIVGGVSAVNTAVEAELGQLAPVERIAGSNRYDTAARLAARFFTPAATSRAYVVNGDNFPDALAAGAASSYTGRPVLLAQTRTLPTATSYALDTLGIEGVTIVGGDNAVEPSVASRLVTLVGSVDRVAGVNRYDTATRLASTITNAGTNVLIATGANFPDALGAAAVAARLDATLILTTPATVPTQTTSYLNRRPPTTITILGGTSAITRSAETQLAIHHLR